MNQRRSVALAAAGATLLATAPMSTLFLSWTWAFDALLVIAAVSGAAIGSRALRARVWVQLLAMLGALIVMMTWIAHGPGAILGTIPTRSTFRAFGGLFTSASNDIRTEGLPVPDQPGLLFVTALGIGVVALVVDLLAVGLRRPAIAGFPMLAIYAIPVFVHPDSVSPIPFAVGAAGFLWLLAADNVDRVRRFGRRFTGDGRGVDLWEPSPLAAAGRRLAVVGVLLAVAIPLAVPGMTGGWLEHFNGSGDGPGVGAGNGKGATVNLFSVLSGKLNLDPSKQFEMLKVTTNDPHPYYLRFAVADTLTTTGFAARPLGAATAVTAGGVPSPGPVTTGVTRSAYHATVTITDFDMPYLPVYQVLTSTQKLDGSWLYDSKGSQVFSRRSSAQKKSYSFDYLSTDYSPAALAAAQKVGPQDPVREFIKAPAQATVQEKVRVLTTGKVSDYDKVLAIFQSFSAEKGFRYSLSTKAGTSGSDIVDFLTNKQGYCEQYAAAMAWMVRAAGIPARVAFGFTRGGGRAPTYTLTNTNLHAWTEVYFTGFGWVPFDATPAASITGAVSPVWAPDVNQHDSTGPSTAPNTGAAPDDSLGAAPHDPRNDPGGAFGGLSTIKPKTATSIWWVLGIGLALLLVVSLPALRRVVLRRRRYRLPRHAGAPNTAVAMDALGTTDATGPPGEMAVVVSPEVAVREAHAAWDELVDTLVDFDVPIDDTQTPRVLTGGVSHLLRLAGPPADALQLLGRAEERARYARTPLAVADLGGSLRSVQRAVAGTASRRARLRAALLPPSVMRRWRSGLGAVGVGVVSRTGRWGDRVTRTLSPRRLLPGGRTGR